jgi:predicted DNA-binding transcriptional regulator AlpA
MIDFATRSQRPAGEKGPAADRELEALLSAPEVARVLDLRPKRVYEVVGHLAVRLAPRTLRWRPSDIESWLRARKEA